MAAFSFQEGNNMRLGPDERQLPCRSYKGWETSLCLTHLFKQFLSLSKKAIGIQLVKSSRR
jgi:hypothetical protein